MYISSTGTQEKTIVARIKPGNDLIESIQEIMKEYDIKSGYIPVIHGCFDELTLLTVHHNPDNPGDPLDETITFKENLVFVGSGTIANSNGEKFVHIHLTAAKKDGSAISGHLLSANILLVTEIVIVKLENIKMCRKIDHEVYDTELLHFE